MLVALVTALALLASACSSGEGPAGALASPSPSASGLATWEGQAASLSRLLFQFTSSAIGWGYEPAGDVRRERGASGPVVFAKVSLVSAEKGSVTFDALQLYVGERAVAEARHDGRVLSSPFYVRNTHRHAQTLPLAASCAIAQYAEQDGLVPGPLVAIGREEFCARLARDGRYSPCPRYCWLVIDDAEIVAVLQQLTP